MENKIKRRYRKVEEDEMSVGELKKRGGITDTNILVPGVYYPSNSEFISLLSYITIILLLN